MVLIESAILSSFFSALGDKLVKKLDEVKEQTKPKDVQIVIVKENPDTYSVTEIDKVLSSSQKWKNKDNPDLEFKNVLEKQCTVKEISLTPDTNFRTKGKVIITIDDSEIFQSKSFTAFQDVNDTVVKINKTIKQESKVKIFLLSSDGTEIGLTVQVTFGD